MEDASGNINALMPKNKKRSRLTLGATMGIIIFILLVLFIARVFTFYRLIQRGDLLELPQFSTRVTRGKIPPIDPTLAAELTDTNDPALGTDTPEITIVEFADFECPYSREAFSVVREMAAKYGNKVRIVYRDFPLDEIHSRARRAALSANCAGAQNKFWQMHDKIYQHADALSDSDLMGYAEEVGLNMTLFSSCLLGGEMQKEIDLDLASGVALGVTGTPTFFINGKKVEGAIPRATFDQLLKSALTKK